MAVEDKSTETVEEVEDQETNDAEAALADSDDGFDELEDEAEETSDKEDEGEADTEDESEEADDDKSGEDKSEEEAAKDEPSDEEKRKAHNREMAEKRIQEKQKREADLKKQQQDYVAAADKEDPRDAAVRQLQVDAYNNKVESNTNKLQTGYDRAVKDFPILSDPSPEIQAEVDAALDAFQGMNVTIDPFGNPIDVRGDLYAYLQRKADSISKLSGLGARTQIANKDKERSKTLDRPSRAPKEPKKDPMMEAFDEEAAK